MKRLCFLYPSDKPMRHNNGGLAPSCGSEAASKYQHRQDREPPLWIQGRILTTHNMYDVDELCDRVSFMVAGRFAALDSPDALKAKFGRRVVTVDYRSGNEVCGEEFALDGLGTNERFLEVIRTYEILKIHSQEATLDQVFNDVTGVKLGEVE
jgi:hypothetical protein